MSPREQQAAVLREQWDLAMSLDLPVVVHNRDSDDEMISLVREDRFKALRGHFHSFAGGLAMAKELVERGFYLGVTGMVTFKRAENIREILQIIPADRLLVETDTPYLAPVPHRGKQNQPAYVVEIARRVAEELGESPAALAESTTANFVALFGRRVDFSQ
jgi:TatD DNase family protein